MAITHRDIVKKVDLSHGIFSRVLNDETPVKPQNKLKRTQKYNGSRWALHGFTLIELLVVIAIIALLVSILLPSLQKAKGLAKTVVCQARMKAAGYGFALYNNENDGTMPTQEGLPGVIYKQAAGQPESWVYKLLPYLDARKWDEPTVLICSMAEISSVPPNADPSNWITTSYWYNLYLSKEDSPVNVASIKKSSEIICLFDFVKPDHLYCWAYHTSELADPKYYPHPQPTFPDEDGALRNLLFTDGRSETVGSYTTTQDQMNNYGEWLP